MKLNNKGFTMVELLVAMAIMGLLIIMAFPTIRAIQTNNTNTKYEEYGKAVVSAAKLYVDSYGEDLFDSSNNQKKSINLDQLIKKDLIKDIGVSGSTCTNGSSVNVIKYKDDYTYCLNLICTAKGTTKDVFKKVSQDGQCKNLTLYQVTYNISNHDPYAVSVIEGNEHTVIDPSVMGFSEANDHVKFDIWTSSQVGNKNPGEKVTVNSNITFNAKLLPLTYKVKYRPSGLSGVSGAELMGPDTCKVGTPCLLKENKFSKDYYSFKYYTYNSGTYKPGYDIDKKVNITSDGQTVNIDATFRKNTLTLNYYSNGGTLKPSPTQVCPVYAGCSKSECKWPQPDTCKGKTGLLISSENTFNYDGFKSLRAYNTVNGSLYMTRSGCTGTDYWFVNEAGSKLKISQATNFKDVAAFANAVNQGNNLKKKDVTVNVFAEWNCPSAITCAAGKYLPANKTTCATCTSGNYCVGGTFNKKSTDQGLSPCPSGYKNSAAGSSKDTQCYMNVAKNHYVKTAKASSSTACASNSYSSAHKVYYGKTSSCSKKYTITIKKGTGVDWVSLDGSKTTLTKTVASGTSVTINADPSDYYQIEKWTDSSGAKKYSSAENTIPVTSNMTLTAVARTNKITLIYYYNGGKLTNGPRQKCLPVSSPQLSGCKKDECADGKTCYKTPGKDDYAYDESWAKEGVRNYAKKATGTIYLTKSGKKATAYWHVGSSGSSIKIHETNETFSTGLKLAQKCGGSYAKDLKTKDITIRLYAGWKNA